MPVEAKPLFRPDALRPHLKAFHVPEAVKNQRGMLAKWAEMLSSGRADRFKEQEILGDFLTDVFTSVLGYSRPADDPERHTISREKHVQVDGKFADAVLGDFREGEPERFFVALEGKGPQDPLDRPHAGRRMSAVDQGYRYAINLPCDWIIVTSIRETRLYHKGSDQYTYERFDTVALAANDALFKKFLYLLGAERVVPTRGRCHLYDLLSASEKVGRDLTKEYYVRYANMRQDAFEVLCGANGDVSRHTVLNATQKILDRVLFAAFCEDRGLLPENTLKHAFEHTDPYNPRPIWENFLGLFRFINTGSPALSIPAYNGGLFADDPLLERLKVSDDICAYFRELGDYEYRSPYEVAAESEDKGAGLIDVDILGHIFEQSITDLEQLRNELDGLVAPQGKEKHKTRRKKEGAFYTPAFITRYIVEHTLGEVLKDRFERLRQAHAKKATGTAVKALADPSVYELEALKKPQREALVRLWECWQDELSQLRIVDPACGSGAFLIDAFDQLHAAFEASNDRLLELRGHATLFDLDRQILQNNLYGVDLNEEAVEICRLSLWIKTAQRGKTLASLDHTIRVGNSIIADPSVHPKAIPWESAFPDVFANGGFDVVISNPPYIRQEWLKPYKAYLETAYKCYSGTADLYLYFYEVGLRILKPGGRIGYITSGTFARANFAGPFRSWLPSVARIERLVNFGENQPFEGAEMVYPTITVMRKDNAPTAFRALFIREKMPLSLNEAVDDDGIDCDDRVFQHSEWCFQPHRVSELFGRVMNVGCPLGELEHTNIYRGVLTGLNDAFIIDQQTRDRLVADDSSCEPLFRKMLRGEDLRPWYYEDENRWLILIPSSADRSWPWSEAGREADKIFEECYPSVYAHLESLKTQLMKRHDKGRYWWELRSCGYYDIFDRPKVFWPDIAKLPRFSLDTERRFTNNKVYLLLAESPWILSVLQSRVSWFCISQMCTPLRLRGGLWQFQCFKQFFERLRVPDAAEADRQRLSELALEATRLARDRYQLHQDVRHRISTDLGSDKTKLNQRLTAWWMLDFGEFRTEVKRALKENIPVGERGEWEKALSDWRGQHDKLTETIVACEEEINDRVYRLFKMSGSDIELLEEHARHAMIDYRYGEP